MLCKTHVLMLCECCIYLLSTMINLNAMITIISSIFNLIIPPSFRPSKIFFIAFFSVSVNGRNLIFGHKHHIGIPYCG